MSQEDFLHEELSINKPTIREMAQASIWVNAKWAVQKICAVKFRKSRGYKLNELERFLFFFK